MTNIEPEVPAPTIGHVKIVYYGPVHPHWGVEKVFGDDDIVVVGDLVVCDVVVNIVVGDVETSQNCPVNPVIQVQLFGEMQVPSTQFILEHIGMLQLLPLHPLLHKQVSGEIHVPLELQEFTPEQLIIEQSDPLYPALQLQIKLSTHVPFPQGFVVIPHAFGDNVSHPVKALFKKELL